MNTYNQKFNRFTLIALAAGIILSIFASCKNQAELGTEEHHEHPVGAVLLMRDSIIAQYIDGNIEGALHVKKGEMSELINIRFLAEDGDYLPLDEPDHSLAWEIADTSFVLVHHKNDEGKWSFHLKGLKQGQTEISLQLLHGNHSDFNTLPFPVIIGK